MVYVRNPANVENCAPDKAVRQDLIEIANIRISVEVLPCGQKVKTEAGDGIRVLYGACMGAA
ncbi:uncharacterized protein B0H64DRAFT_408341 [Chaetomium fimeti]|uniref:Aldos-2-ulose dehydratase/isomerase (AUDH) Cupin domain-containing protein n=1 Tax=Chaetomium fimeti TaxID=1854472 RepID=A0AAE0LNP5_9PEZI|nr:hypothetical protein B0H64DRAFT_408341 [Chaetomium fimeti]